MTRLLKATGFEVMAHQVAAPFIRGQGVKILGKRFALYSVQVVFRLTGVNFGGILIYARKKADGPNTDMRGH
jgi:hypothetical protein